MQTLVRGMAVPHQSNAFDVDGRGLPVKAAQYLRMSTDHQKYSIMNQAAAIAEYAAARGIAIVKTYEDAGRSGLRLDGRDGLPLRR